MSLAAKTPYLVNKISEAGNYNLLIDDSETTFKLFKTHGLGHRVLKINPRLPHTSYTLDIVDAALCRLRGEDKTAGEVKLTKRNSDAFDAESYPYTRFKDPLYYPLIHARDQIESHRRAGGIAEKVLTGKLTIYYRISDTSAPVEKLPNATKEHCLENCLGEFLDKAGEINIVADNVRNETWERLLRLTKKHKGVKAKRTCYGTWKESFAHILEKALEELPLGSPVYFLEDDYLHKKGSYEILMEGLGVADYVTLYDHPDHYINADEGGNPEVSGGGEDTTVFLTGTSHWKFTNSTTSTFAATTDILKDDKAVWYWSMRKEAYHDYHAFARLRKEKSRTIASPIPGYATHCRVEFLAPLTNWREI